MDKHSESQPEQQDTEKWYTPLTRATLLSKYFAMVLFVLLPFIGGWIGYTFAPEKIIEIGVGESAAETEQISQKYLLTVNGSSFEITTSERVKDKTVVYESDVPILFGLPWFVDDESQLLTTQGTELNEKIYVSLWLQSPVNASSEQLNENDYEWFLGEYNPGNNEFELILDSRHLLLDDTYNEQNALYLDPLADYENEAGHIVFLVILCTRCGAGPNHYAVLNYNTHELSLLGTANLFEWTSSTTYRYKTERERGISHLDTQTKQYVDEHYKNCADYPTMCYQQIEWSKIPWQEGSI